MKTLIPLLTLIIPLITQAQVSVGNIWHRGLGCPQGSVSTSVAPDGSSISILYDSLSAEIPEGSSVLTSKEKCWTKININIPEGKQLVIEGADYRGFYNLTSSDQIAGFNSRFYFNNGAAWTGRGFMPPWAYMGGFGISVPGPAIENFVWRVDTFGILQVSPCGGNTELNIINLVGITSSKPASGSAVFDTMDTQLTQTYRVRFANCPYTYHPYSGSNSLTPDREKVGGVGWYEGR